MFTAAQAEHADTRPDLIHATALLIAQHYRGTGIPGVEVRADAWIEMNGRPARRIIHPAVDLATQARTPAPNRWILPAPSRKS